MAVKILISRQFRQDKMSDAHNLPKEMRSVATLRPGYISGQTLASADIPNKLVVVSTWSGPKRWEAWYKDQKRIAFSKKLEGLLVAPEQVEVFMAGHEASE
jgi:heme oxygenase (mycobilin-producing)